MKFNLKRYQVEIEPHPESPGMFRVTKGCEFFDESNVLRLEYLKEHFTPVDCEAVDLVDPDRTERLCRTGG